MMQQSTTTYAPIFYFFVVFMDDEKKKEHANIIEFLIALELVDPMLNAPLGWIYCPTVRKLDVVQGTAQIWQNILDVVTNNGFRQPPADVLHRRCELTEIGLM